MSTTARIEQALRAARRLEAIQKARLAPFDESKTPPPKHLAGRFTELPNVDGVETSVVVEEEA